MVILAGGLCYMLIIPTSLKNVFQNKIICILVHLDKVCHTYKNQEPPFEFKICNIEFGIPNTVSKILNMDGGSRLYTEKFQLYYQIILCHHLCLLALGDLTTLSS